MKLKNVPTFRPSESECRKSGFRYRAKARSSERNLRLQIEYEGTNYAGWQVQNGPVSLTHGPAKRTVQDVLEKALCKLLREKVKLIVSGRTDAGVHALAQVANFKTGSKLAALKLRRALNAILPADISVLSVKDAPAGFHSRFSARSKIYRYCILNRSYPSALWRGRAYYFAYPLDVGLMRAEAACILGRHDFSAFCASSSVVKSKRRRIKNISLKKRNGGYIDLEIEADGFLYNMARNIAGTLIEIGRGRFKKGDMKRILRSRDRRKAGPCAPAEGLYLVRVKY